MITFVPSFVSQEFTTYDHDFEEAQKAARERIGKDDKEALHREAEAWRAAHPAPKVTLSQVADQIEYVKKIVGPDHIGLGGDFDGISMVVTGLEDVSTYPALFAELVHRGWSDEDLRKLAGENVLRALGKAEEVAARLQKTRAPSTKTILQLDGTK